MEAQTLHVDELLHEGYRVQELLILVLPVPVEHNLRSWRGLEGRNLSKVRVLNCLFDSQTLPRTKAQQLCQQVQSHRSGSGKTLCPCLHRVQIVIQMQSRLIFADVVTRRLLSKLVDLLFRQLSKTGLDELHLVQVVLASEQRLSVDELSENTANCP